MKPTRQWIESIRTHNRKALGLAGTEQTKPAGWKVVAGALVLGYLVWKWL